MSSVPEVPMFVEEWFKRNRDGLESNLHSLPINMEDEYDENDLFYTWFADKKNKPAETLIRMKLEGYKVVDRFSYGTKNNGLHYVWANEKDELVAEFKFKHYAQTTASLLNLDGKGSNRSITIEEDPPAWF